MIFGCKHDWVRIAKTYLPSMIEMGQAQGMESLPFPNTVSAAREYMFTSTTTILWECSICKQTKKEVLLGKEDNK